MLLIQSYDISASGGDADQNFRVSLGYKDSEAVNMGSSFESISGSVHTQENLVQQQFKQIIWYQMENNWVNWKVLYTLEIQTLQNFFMPMTEAAFNPDGSYLVPHPASMHHTYIF